VNRVVADSNIYVSAFLRGGKPLELLELARARQIEVAVSSAILEETARVLATKFKVPEDDILAFYEELRGVAKLVTPTETLDAVPGDKTDNRILEAAVAAGAETVVTGDVHLLSVGEFRGIRIQRVADFLATFQARGR
jgi:putative PIN family toxin of toxin-antitoxin system